MVPGLLGSVMPFLSARPDLGRTWHSTPSGSSMDSPVATIRISPGCNVTDSSAERMS